MKWKGATHETSSFASGLILHCPKISEEKKHLKEMLAELLMLFEITHVLIIDSADISNYLTRNCPAILRFNAPKIEGVDSLLKLQKKNKLTRYFGSDHFQLLKLPIAQVTLYELIESENRTPYVRTVDIRTELVNKTAVSILNCQSTPPPT